MVPPPPPWDRVRGMDPTSKECLGLPSGRKDQRLPFGPGSWSHPMWSLPSGEHVLGLYVGSSLENQGGGERLLNALLGIWGWVPGISLGVPPWEAS